MLLAWDERHEKETLDFVHIRIQRQEIQEDKNRWRKSVSADDQNENNDLIGMQKHIPWTRMQPVQFHCVMWRWDICVFMCVFVESQRFALVFGVCVCFVIFASSSAF